MNPKTSFAALLLLSSPALAEDIVGSIRAVDGDTLAVGAQRIRLFGIDAPEAAQTCNLSGSAWTCGADAAAALGSMVDGNQVNCKPIETDVYGRTVARCHAGGKDLAAEMVRSGLAVAYERGVDLYGGIEAQSKAYRAGVWGSEFEMPASYRDSHAPKPRMQVQRTGPPISRSVVKQSQVEHMYRSCPQARSAGAAPMYRGQPGYNPNLDGDNDGIACEPYIGGR